MVSFGYLFHDSKRTPITEAYIIKDALGTGKFSVVKEGVEIATSKPCALKIMKKSVVQDNNLVKEVEIMRQLKHPNIISLLDIYETDSELILVLELVTGGELFEKIVERVSYTEEDAAKLVKQIASVVEYLHSKDIVHCDLKPENLLYSDTSNDAVIKLCDFGLSQELKPNNSPLTSIIGTPTYMAPEIMACVGYGKPVDMWSFGVIVYILLCGFPPFDETTGTVLEFPSPEWDDISTSVKDLITNLLVVDTTKRFTVQQVMSHLWVSGATAGKHSIAGALKTMRVFNTCRKSGTTFRGTQSHRASVFSIFPAEKEEEKGEKVEEGEKKIIAPEDLFPAADSPAFVTIHNPLAALEIEFSTPHSPPSPSLTFEDLRSSGGDKRTPRTKEIMEGRGREGSGTRWDGADSKEMLARELGLLLQANPQFLRSMSTEVTVASGASATQNTLSTQGHMLLEDLMNSLGSGGGEFSGDLVRPLSGHFSRVAHLEDQVKDAQVALDSERNAHAQMTAQITQAQDESHKILELCKQGGGELEKAMRKLVHTLDGIVVNTGKGGAPREKQSTHNMEDTIEGLKEENATLDKLYRQTKAELESLQQEIKDVGGGGHDSLRKKNQQLAKELEILHKDYETLLHTKGGSDDAGTDDSDEFYEDKRRRKAKSGGAGFLKRIIG